MEQAEQTLAKQTRLGNQVSLAWAKKNAPIHGNLFQSEKQEVMMRQKEPDNFTFEGIAPLDMHGSEDDDIEIKMEDTYNPNQELGFFPQIKQEDPKKKLPMPQILELS